MFDDWSDKSLIGFPIVVGITLGILFLIGWGIPELWRIIF